MDGPVKIINMNVVRIENAIDRSNLELEISVVLEETESV
jgi:hypothetical protein